MLMHFEGAGLYQSFIKQEALEVEVGLLEESEILKREQRLVL